MFGLPSKVKHYFYALCGSRHLSRCTERLCKEETGIRLCALTQPCPMQLEEVPPSPLRETLAGLFSPLS